jgi:hypothetical protein
MSRCAPSSYGIIINDGGSSFVTIAFCPWCASPLGRRRQAYQDKRVQKDRFMTTPSPNNHG